MSIEQEAKQKNLIAINEWVKEQFNNSGLDRPILIHDAFHSGTYGHNYRSYKISISKNGISVCGYGKFSPWLRINDTEIKQDNLIYMITGNDLIYNWSNIKAKIEYEIESEKSKKELMLNFTV